MADDKLNTNPQENTPPDVAALLGADTPPEHEQAVISGMGEEAPAPAGKVIDLSGIKTAADHSGKEPTAPNVADRPPEVVPDQKRRGRPPKEQAAVSAGKRRKRRSPAQAARLRLTRRPVRRPRPLFGTKCPEVRKLTRARKRAPAVRLCLNPLRR